MDFRMNGTVERAIEKAREEVKSFKSTRVTDEFLLFALYKEVQYQTVGKCLSNYGFNLFTFRYYLDSKNKNIAEPDFSESSEIELSLQAIETLSKAKEYADLTEKVEIYSAHLILALLESDNKVIVEKALTHFKEYSVALYMKKEELIISDIEEINTKDDIFNYKLERVKTVNYTLLEIKISKRSTILYEAKLASHVA